MNFVQTNRIVICLGAIHLFLKENMFKGETKINNCSVCNGYKKCLKIVNNLGLKAYINLEFIMKFII